MIGALTTVPPVYNSGSPVCFIVDFAVAHPAHWPAIGAALFEATMQREAKARGAVLMVVVCAQRDQAKRSLLRDVGLSVASEWYVGSL